MSETTKTPRAHAENVELIQELRNIASAEGGEA